MRHIFVAIVAAGLGYGVALVPGASTAQAQMTAAEITEKLNAQRELQRSSRGTQACPDGGVDCVRGIQVVGQGGAGNSAAPSEAVRVERQPAPQPEQPVQAARQPQPAATPSIQETARVTPARAPSQPEYHEYGDAERLDVVILFEYDSSYLRPTARPQLAELCTSLRAVNDSIVIFGHTDSVGSSRYNQTLSENRARAVKAFLISDECGIPAERLTAVGMGESKLLEGKAPEADAQRRVEFQLNLSS